MNRIVREHYPAARLPDDLREGLNAAEVRVVVEAQPSGAVDDLPLTRILEDMQRHRVLAEDPVTRIRALRAEWGRRDKLNDRTRSGDRD